MSSRWSKNTENTVQDCDGEVYNIDEIVKALWDGILCWLRGRIEILNKLSKRFIEKKEFEITEKWSE